MKSTSHFWDRLSKNYDDFEEIKKVEKYESIGMIKKYLKNSDTVLDFGCATGTISAVIARYAQKVQGIDLSPKMISIAKERALERDVKNIDFTVALIEENPFKKETFDMVINFSVLHLVENLSETCKSIYELLKPDAYFISLTPCIGEKAFGSTWLRIAHKIGLIPHIRAFKIKELESCISKSNFNILECIPLQNNPLETLIIAQKI